jgi:hypothetical protein
MVIFIVLLIVAGVAGGFVGGELTGGGFSALGAVIGSVGTATVLLSLGAYFSAQEDKKKRDLTPEMRGVFDRMITGKANPTQAEIDAAKRSLRQRR